MNEAQTRVQAVLDDLVARDVETGLQVAAYHHGEPIVDAWSGLADRQTGRLVDGDIIFCVYSAGKGVTSTVVHLLAERGLIDYDDPVARYWPEFGANGKDHITIRQVMTHTAGVPRLPEGIGPGEIGEWEATCAAIAGLTPMWEPGSSAVYHAITFGHILGELVRRVDGRPIDQVLQEDICQPLGIESLYLHLPAEAEPRLARHEGGVDPSALPAGAPLRSMPDSLFPAEAANQAGLRRACIPALAWANARSLALFYAALIAGRILERTRLAEATSRQTGEPGLRAAGVPPMALGYMLAYPYSPRTVFGHMGYGGADGVADSEHGLAFALAKNRINAASLDDSASYLAFREILSAHPSAGPSS